MLWNGYSLITSKLWLNLSGNIWTERCWTAFYICQFHLDLGWACYHDGMPHRCKGTKCEHVQVRGRESGHRNVGLSRHRTRYCTWTKRLLLPSCKDRWRNPHLNRFLVSLIPPLFFLFASWCVYLSLSLAHLSFTLSCSFSLLFLSTAVILFTFTRIHKWLQRRGRMFLKECICSQAGIRESVFLCNAGIISWYVLSFGFGCCSNREKWISPLFCSTLGSCILMIFSEQRFRKILWCTYCIQAHLHITN